MNSNRDLNNKLAELRKLFPDCVAETDSKDGKKYIVDIDKLCGKLGIEETYRFCWTGKNKALQEANRTTRVRLSPKRELSRDWRKTKNVYVEGDNLKALKALQRDYEGKVDAIYIDPPYNTGTNTFVYRDDFSTTQNGVTDLHSKWLSMMFSRLIVSRNLLADSGAIFVSINDNEYANTIQLLDEVYGHENYVTTIVWDSKREAKGIPPKSMCVKNHEYIICYSKNGNYRFIGDLRCVEDGFTNPDSDPRGPWKRQYLQRFGQGFPLRSIINPDSGKSFTFETPYTQEKLDSWIMEGRVIFPDSENRYPARKEFFQEYQNPYKPIVTSWGLFSAKVGSEQLKSLFDGKKVFDYPKPLELLKILLRRTVRPDALVMDFFAGSGSFGHAVMELNAEDNGKRRFILIQSPEACRKRSEAFKWGYANVSAICMERLRRAGDMLKKQKGNSKLDVGFRVYTLE